VAAVVAAAAGRQKRGPLTTFSNLQLISPLLRALDIEGHQHPTPIQSKAIPALLAGRDVLACAQTGTGKTAAFVLPTLQRLSSAASQKRAIRTLVLAPTRELAAQIGERIAAYGQFTPLKHLVVFGGVKDQPQIAALRRGVDILVATPGRLLDLMTRGHVNLDAVEVFVLDEADRMLDMGFIADIRRVARTLPHERQSLMFSATMPAPIEKLARSLLSRPVRIDVAPERVAVTSVTQSMVRVDQAQKGDVLLRLLREPDVERAIVFTRTKRGANKLSQLLDQSNLGVSTIHGNKSQNARRRALDDFRSGRCSILVATDIAARGIDVESVTHVYNFDLPLDPESYVHRIGRTGRAGRCGVAVSLCSPVEMESLRAIERLVGFTLAGGRQSSPEGASASSASPTKPARPRAGRSTQSRYRVPASRRANA